MRSQLFCVEKKLLRFMQRTLCCFRAVVLLLLASCVFLVFSCRALAGFSVFSYWAPFFLKHFLAGEGGRLRIPGTPSLKGYITDSGSLFVLDTAVVSGGGDCRMVCFGDMYGGCHGVWGCCVVACGL